MNTTFFKAMASTVLLVSSVALAEVPLAGNWKFDQGKSKLTGETLHFAKTADGAMRVTGGGQSYTFKLDGSDSTTPTGNTAQWTKVDDNTWQSVIKKGSTTLSTDTYKISDAGKTLNVTFAGTKPNGDSFNDTEVYTRVAGTKGFVGAWKSDKLSLSSPTGYEIKDNGDGSITWVLPDYHASVNMKLDGKDYPATGPTVPDDLTLSLTKIGPRKYAMVEKMKGKPIFKGTETI